MLSAVWGLLFVKKKLGFVKRPGKSELSSEVDAKLSREPKVRHCLIEKYYIHLDNRKLKKFI